MKRVIFWLYLLMKRQLKNPIIIALLIMLPVGAVVVKNVSALNETQAPKIGIVLLDEDPIAKQMVKYLTSGDYNVDFYEASSVKQLEDDCLNGKTECGYIVGENLKTRLDNHNYEGCMELIIKGSDFISSMTNEIVFSAMLKAYSIEIAVNYVDSIDKYDKYFAQAEVEMRQSYQEYLDSTETFHIDFRMLDEDGEGTKDLEQSDGQFPIDKVLIILIYVAGLFGTVQFYMDEERGTFVTLSKGYRIAGRPVYAFIGSVLFALSSLVTMAIADSSVFPEMIWKMIIYVMAITLFSWGLSMIVKSSKGMISVIPVLLIACLVMCPVFINLSVYVPVIKLLQKLLLPYYMM